MPAESQKAFRCPVPGHHCWPDPPPPGDASACYQPFANEVELAKHMLDNHQDYPSTLFAYILLNTAPALRIVEELQGKADPRAPGGDGISTSRLA
jgi:hypothetical protein